MSNKIINEAYQAIERQDYAKANSIIQPLLAQEPENASAMICRGAILLFMGDIENAMPTLIMASELAPEDENVWLFIGIALDRVGKFEEAIEAFEQAVAITPDSVGINFYLGIALRNAGKFEEAINELDKFRQVMPDDPTVAVELARAYMMAVVPEMAIGLYETAVKSLKDNAELLAELANAYSIVEREDEALQLFDKAVHLDPNSFAVRLGRGTFFYKLKRYSDADRDLAEAVAQNQSSVGAYELFVLNAIRQEKEEIATGRLQHALEAFDELSDEFLNDVDVKQIIDTL
ncbi:Tetratricopeptide (TPR) repeat [Candidatus Methanophagaceae archaeon]|nr:Tetratricopeptide (TPR) repeat [Methanophagales archaeon]